MTVIRTPFVPDAPEIAAAVLHPARIAAVLATGLLDSPPEEAFDDLVGLARRLTGARHAVFAVVDAQRCFRKSVVGPGVEQGGHHPVHDSILRLLVTTGEAVFLADARTDDELRGAAPAQEVGAVCCLPVHSPDGQIVGGLCVTDPGPRHWTATEVDALITVARAISSQIMLRESLSTSQDRADALGAALADSEARRQDSAALARTLQTSILPPVLPAIPGTDTAAAYLPARAEVEVVGDFYDLFRAGRDWCVVMGDVCGKGVEAARVTALARYTIRTEATQHPDPRIILERLHEALHTQYGGVFLTAVVAMLRPDGGGGLVGTISGGGHEPALIRRVDGTVETLPTGGTLLGLLDRPRPDAVAVHLAPGDMLVLYTDGVTEARPGPGGDPFDDDRLVATLADCHGLGADAVVDRIISTVLTYANGNTGDDTAVLVVRADPAP